MCKDRQDFIRVIAVRSLDLFQLRMIQCSGRQKLAATLVSLLPLLVTSVIKWYSNYLPSSVCCSRARGFSLTRLNPAASAIVNYNTMQTAPLRQRQAQRSGKRQEKSLTIIVDLLDIEKCARISVTGYLLCNSKDKRLFCHHVSVAKFARDQ